MPWWGWTIIGVLMFAVELIAIDAHFYLVFLGAAAIIVGAAGLIGIDMPVWVQWLLFAALSVTLMFTVRQQLYEKMRAKPIGAENLIGVRLVLAQELAPGASCRADYQGSTWTAVNVGRGVIPAGGAARVDSVDGVRLHVSAAAD